MISLCKLIMCVVFYGRQLGLLLTSGTLLAGMVIEVGQREIVLDAVARMNG